MFKRLLRKAKLRLGVVICSFRDARLNDPVKNCHLYRKEGCAHVDGSLCDYPKCKMNRDYIEENYT